MPTGLVTSILVTLKAWCMRAARSPITLAFFLSMLANYATQTTLHGIALSYYTRNRDLVTGVIDAAGVQRGFAVVQKDALEICSGIPRVYGTTCHTVYNGSTISVPTSALDIQCAEGLTWLENYLVNCKSEEVLYLFLESWLFAISLVALLDESIPHLIVVLAAQLVNTGWISYRIARDISANRIHNEMVVAGACGGFDILSGSWQYDMFYVTLSFSVAALLGMSLLVCKLIKLYSKSKLSSVGSPPLMSRMLKWRLWMRVFLQLTTFFTLACAAIWYDKRRSVSYYSANILYDVGFYTVVIITLPWMVLGTYSISKENRLLFLVYAVLSIILLVISGLWFGSTLYRYEYWDWRTFSCATTMADALLLITCILSVVCRLNFGQGLAHFLIVEQKLQASGFTYDTFLNDPSSTWTSSVGVKQVTNESLSIPGLERSKSPFRSLKHPLSICSIESAVFATWLSYTAREDRAKCKLKTAVAERPVDVVIISKEDMSTYDIESVSDNGCMDVVAWTGSRRKSSSLESL